MSCCATTIVPFFNTPSTSIAFTGRVPKVTVYYFDPVMVEYYTVNGVPGSGMKIVGSNVIIDHGGPSTGVVKIE